MERISLPIRPAALLALFITLCSTAMAKAPVVAAEEAVELTGWLHVEDHSFSGATVAVKVNGAIREAIVSETGRFTVTLPAGTEAVLRFEMPGHLTKEVVVDTHFAQDGVPGQRVRRVRFAVILELERHMAGFRYQGPVGSIGFDQGGGCMAVARERKLVPAKRQATMVF
jgi:hypothetical protein